MTFPVLTRLKRALGLAAPIVLACSFSGAADAQTTLTTELVANGFQKPVEAIGNPDGRIFVVEQNSGLIRIIGPAGGVLATPFLNIKSKIKSSGNEEGLLGLAFHPDYENNGFFYVNYTASGPNRTVVERYSVSATDKNIADPTSGAQIIAFNQPFSNHNGGCLRFGSDGYLYIATGDGGSANDPQCNAQNPGSFLGKMLRLDVDSGLPYTVPPSNPFVTTAGYLPEIWAIGLRNPWRFGFDSLNGDMYIGDVGQSTREEVNVSGPGNGGFNYGWKIMEGVNCFQTGNCPVGTFPPCNNPALTLPATDYGHSGPFGGPCSITGGEVSRDCSIPGFFGTYYYADYCSDQIFSFEYVGGVVTNHVQRTAELAPGGGLSLSSITSFGVDGDGAVLIVDQGGEIFRIIAASQPALADCDGNGMDDTCEIAVQPTLDMNGNGILDSCEGCGFSTYGVGASPVNYMTLAGAGGTGLGGAAQFVTTGVLTGPVFDFVSLAQANAPIVGGVGLVNLGLVILTGVAPAAGGTAVYNAPIPTDPTLAGLSVYIQSAAPDSAQPGGWGLSNGLQLTLCP